MSKCRTEDCEHEATLCFSTEPIFSITHGFNQNNMCQCCYVKKIETELEKIKKNLIKQKNILKEKGCE